MAKYELIVTVEDSHKVNARTPDDEEANADFAMDPLTRRTIAIFEGWLRNGKITHSSELQVLGMHLYRAIFNGAVEALFERVFRQACSQQERLRVQLSFRQDVGELASLPWEYLYYPDTDAEPGFCFATALTLVLSRYMPSTSKRDETLRSTDNKLRILVVVSQPTDLGPVIAEPVIEQIEKLKEQLPIELTVHTDTTLDSLVDKIEEVNPNVVHFIGHGRFNRDEAQGQIALLAAVTNVAEWCADDQFASVFTQVRARPRLVFLQLCESATVELSAFSATFAGLAPKLIQAKIPAVLAMQYPISNLAAIAFSKAFYESLGKGEAIDDSVQKGRFRITTRVAGAMNSRVFGTPVLYMRSRDGILLPQNNPLSGAAGGKP